MVSATSEWLVKGAKVAVLGVGSFNPPTIMHLRMFELAKDHLVKLGCRVVDGILSPVADSFGKPNLVKAVHRFEMARRAVQSSDWIRADDWECTQAGWTRTLSVLKHFDEEVKNKHGDSTRLMLVCGGDVVDSFVRILPNGENLWSADDVRSIISDYGIVVVTREKSCPLETLAGMPTVAEHLSKVQIVREEVCPSDVSSTRIRAAIADGKSIKYSTPDSVIQYIEQQGLYR